MSIWYICVTDGSERSDGPEVRALEGVCANAAPAAMPPPTEAREGCSGLMGDACARQLELDGGTMVESMADDRTTFVPSTVTQIISNMFVVGAGALTPSMLPVPP